jgi:hypothetical protein
MCHARCRAVYPRDGVTCANLRKAGVPAYDLGNPMMDGLEPRGIDLPKGEGPTLVLLPGSRPAEAGRNLARLASLARQIGGTSLAALAGPLEGPAPEGVHLLQGAFADALHAADLVLAMAGTATEQAVGLGKPVISIAGEGPQFTPHFAEAQTRLLGPSVMLRDPAQPGVAEEARQLLGDPARLARIAENGRERMGLPGASERIAAAIAKLWSMKTPT